MANDKKVGNNEIKSRKNNKFLKKNHKKIWTLSIVCILVLGVTFLAYGKIIATSRTYNSNLLEYQNTSAKLEEVENSLNAIEYSVFFDSNLSYYLNDLKIDNKNVPYEATLSYKLETADKNTLNNDLYKNSAIIFSLIQNIDKINFEVKLDKNTNTTTFTRTEMEKDLNLKFNALNKRNYSDFILKLSNKINGYKTVDKAISAYLNRLNYDSDDEFNANYHILLGKNQKESEIEIYLLEYGAGYSFTNGVFYNTSGYSSIPTLLNLCKNDNGEYCIISSMQAEDGEGFSDSINAMFPKKEALQAFDAQGNHRYANKAYEELNKQAKDYLKSINRDSDVVTLLQTQDISNNFNDFCCIDIDNYLDFLGSYEQTKKGKRYVYRSFKDGNIYNFAKYDGDRNLISNNKFKYNNGKLEKLSGSDSSTDLTNGLFSAISLVDNYDGTYDVKMRIENIDKDKNMLFAYALDGSKYEILDTTDSTVTNVKLINQVTNKTINILDYNKVDKNGAYFATDIDFASKYSLSANYALELQFRIKPNETPADNDKIQLEICSYNGKLEPIKFSNQKIDLYSNKVENQKSIIYNLNDFYIETSDSY